MDFLYTDQSGAVHLMRSIVGDGLTRFEQEPVPEPEPVSIDQEDE